MGNHYDTVTKPALNALGRMAGKGTLDELRAAVNACADAMATKNEIVEAFGGVPAWNAFVKKVKKATKAKAG